MAKKDSVGGIKLKRIWTYLIGILCVIGGILFICNPNDSQSTLVFYFGLMIILTGILRIVLSIVIKSYFLPGSGFISGVWNILFGILLMANSSSAVEMIPLFLGLWLLVSAISNIISIYNFRRIYIDYWFLTKAILKLVLSILIFTAPDVSIILSGTVLGIALIVIGIITIISYKDDDNVYSVKVK